MIEAKGDVWTYPADARVVTTNAMIRSNGGLVMGGGIALAAAKKFAGNYCGLPSIEHYLGHMVRTQGNHCFVTPYHEQGGVLVSFPTKNDWRDDSDLDLIDRSAYELLQLWALYNWDIVVLPRVGCGLGNLDWNKQVKPVLNKYFNDQFVVVT